MSNFSGNVGCSVPGGVNLTRETLKIYDYVLEDYYPEYNYLTKARIRSLNVKSNLDTSLLFNKAFFSFREKEGDYTYSDNSLYSGELRHNEPVNSWTDLGAGTIYKVGGFTLNNTTSTSGTSNQVKFFNLSESGQFSVYCRNEGFFPSNENILQSSYSLRNMVKESHVSGVLIRAENGTNGPVFCGYAYKNNGDVVTVATNDNSLNALETDGVLLTYRDDNKLRIYSCLRDGSIVSGETSESFTRLNTGNNDITVVCPYSGYMKIQEFAVSNSGLSDNDLSLLETLHKKISDRLSSDTTSTPNSGDYHIVHKLDYIAGTTLPTNHYFGSAVNKTSGAITSFYDIAHSNYDTYSMYSSFYNNTIPFYRFKEPCDSGVILFETWCELTNPVSGAIIHAPLFTSVGGNRDFQWISNSGVIQPSGINKVTLSGHFISSSVYPGLLNEDINHLASRTYINVGSISPIHTDLKIYSARYYLTGWASPPTGVVNSGTLFVSGKESLSSGTTLFILGDVNDNLPLYIAGPTLYSGNKNTTLFIRTQYGQSGQPTNNIPLYIRSYIENSGELPLYIGGPSSVTVTNNMPLYLQNTVYSGTNNIPLTIRTQYSQSGQPYDGINLFMNSVASSSGQLPLYINGPSSYSPNTTAPLYIAGPTVYSLNNTSQLKPVSLFVANNFGSGTKTTTLYVSSKVESSGTYNLHTIGGGTDRRSGNATLFVSNFTSQSGSIPLYMTAGINEYFFNLVVGGKNPDTISGNFPLFINATLDSGITKFTTLNIKSDGTGAGLPLFVKSNTSDENSDRLNLYLHNDTSVNKQIDMFIKNSTQNAGSGTRLFVKGSGQNNGFYAANNSMNLYINRGNDSISKATVLYLESVKQDSGTVNLFIDATRRSDSGVTMVVPNVTMSNTNNTSLYTHGY